MNPHDDNNLNDHDGPSEADIIGMLSTYGDALEKAAATPASATPQSEATTGNALAGTPRPPSVGESAEVLDLGVGKAKEPSSGRGRVLVGAIAAAVAIVVGGFVLAGVLDDNSQVDAAAEADQTPAEDDSASEDATDSTQSTTTVQDDVEADITEADPTETEALFFDAGISTSDNVVVTDDGFARLGSEGGAPVLFTSPNGTDWSATPTSGLPAGAMVFSLDATNSGWVAVLEIWPAFDPDASAFGFDGNPERFLATSADLVTWTPTPIEQLDDTDGLFAFIQSVAVSGDSIAILAQFSGSVGSEFDVLLEAGLITESEVENICGTEFSEGGAYVITSCGEELIVREGEPVTDIEPEGFGDEVLRLEPGDEFYDEVIEAALGPDVDPVPTVLTGPVAGPLEVIELPGINFAQQVLGTDVGFFAVGSSPLGEGQILTSSDGLTWSELAPSEVNFGFIQQLAASGDRLLVTSNAVDEPNGDLLTFVSDDGGVSWSESFIPSDLFNVFGLTVGGEAGFVIEVQGTLEPDDPNSPNPFETDLAEIVVDGFTMTLSLVDGTASLTGPDGVIIHDFVDFDSEDAFLSGGVDNIVRFEGPFDETTVWLDPETGEDLVTFTDDDINAVFEELFPTDGFSDFDIPPRGAEVWFSADGVSWELLESRPLSNDFSDFSLVAAVSGDAALRVTQTFAMPPEELLAFETEGRPPTDDETAALDAWFEENATTGPTNTWEVLPLG